VKVKAYQSYQESRVEWFSAVPDHWEVLPCRAIVDERNEKNEGLKSDFYLSLLANIGIIPYEEKGDIGNKKPEDLEKCKLVERGDLVINSMNYGIGSFGLSELSGVCSPVYIVLCPKSEMIEERFALRIFECRDFQTYAQSFGNGILAHRAAINWDILKVLRVPVPPRSEQNLILQYLDQETGKIDALVAEQERLIALLKEKRQAVISQAVTKGLNPNAPMKDSGIEWLGQVPAHWQLGRLKQFGTLQGGTGFPPDLQGLEGEELPFFKVADLGASEDGVKMGSGNHSISRKTADELRAKIIPVGSILYAKIGAALLLNRRRITTVECCVDNNLSAYTPLSDRLRSGWAFYWLSIIDFGKVVNPGAVPSFSEGDQSVLPIVIPPLPEQDRLIDQLSTRTRKLDSLITEATQAITLLRERRAALISAAVTGKIDVRALATSQPEAA